MCYPPRRACVPSTLPYTPSPPLTRNQSPILRLTESPPPPSPFSICVLACLRVCVCVCVCVCLFLYIRVRASGGSPPSSHHPVRPCDRCVAQPAPPRSPPPPFPHPFVISVALALSATLFCCGSLAVIARSCARQGVCVCVCAVCCVSACFLSSLRCPRLLHTSLLSQPPANRLYTYPVPLSLPHTSRVLALHVFVGVFVLACICVCVSWCPHSDTLFSARASSSVLRLLRRDARTPPGAALPLPLLSAPSQSPRRSGKMAGIDPPRKMCERCARALVYVGGGGRLSVVWMERRAGLVCMCVPVMRRLCDGAAAV